MLPQDVKEKIYFRLMFSVTGERRQKVPGITEHRKDAGESSTWI